MTVENGLVPFNQNLENVSPLTWQEFVIKAEGLENKLADIYDESPVERREYYRDVCRGGYNFGKTVKWVVNYSPHPKTLDSIASALEAIALWPNAGSMAWEMRRFIKFSSDHGYNNIDDVAEFGELIKKIGIDDPTNKNGFQIDMDFFYWDSGFGIDDEATPEKILQAHCDNVTGIIKGLEKHAHPEIIDGERLPTPEEIEAQEQEEKKQYWKDFLADAKYHYPHPSFFNILDREELINRPYHRILAYPAGFQDILSSTVWNPGGHKNVSDAVEAFYKEHYFMLATRAKNWFPSPLPPDYEDYNNARFENRLRRTLAEKPWLIDFSVKWQKLLQKSFVGGNHQTNHAGEVELLYKNPRYDSHRGDFLKNEYEYRTLLPDEEKLFLESVVSVKSLIDQDPPVKPPKHPYVFNGQTGEPFIFTLSDGRAFSIFLKHEYASLHWEGSLVIVTQDGPKPLFLNSNLQLESGTK